MAEVCKKVLAENFKISQKKVIKESLSWVYKENIGAFPICNMSIFFKDSVRNFLQNYCRNSPKDLSRNFSKDFREIFLRIYLKISPKIPSVVSSKMQRCIPDFSNILIFASNCFGNLFQNSSGNCLKVSWRTPS